jgi:hypothetical protein
MRGSLFLSGFSKGPLAEPRSFLASPGVFPDAASASAAGATIRAATGAGRARE